MNIKKRLYDTVLLDHFNENRQMVFVSGPRQVGKTTACGRMADSSLNWDNADDREIILSGPEKLAQFFGADRLHDSKPKILFDELHKYSGWKQLLKGFFDTYSEYLLIMVTGSSRMDIFKKGGDSLMGRYFLYRMHPFSTAEIIDTGLPDTDRIIRQPRDIPAEEWSALWEYGGFPEPFLKRNTRFSNRWQRLRNEQLISEDITKMTQIQQIAQLEVLVNILLRNSAAQLTYSNLAKNVRVAVDTVRRWVDILCRMHLGFLIRPWYKNISRSLRKEPKWYLRDWARISDRGSRAETFTACHLLKAVQGWTDMGLGEFHLGYLRDKSQREVDFIVIRDGEPWFLVEVKYKDEEISDSLRYFQKITKAPFAFQVLIEADYVDADCFASPRDPIIVPARTLFSQLL